MICSYTEKFHEAEFPGYSLSRPLPEILEDFWHQQDIPVIEIEHGLDLSDSYQYVLDHNDEIFTTQSTKINKELWMEKNGSSWYYTPHSQGWNQCMLIGQAMKSGSLVPGTEDIIPLEFSPPGRTDILTNLRLQLKQLGLEMIRLQVLQLEPGGWISPHRDTKPTPNHPTMNYFWMPLHDFSQCLKYWPQGYIQHRLGCMYLFNYQKYVHSVVNYDDEPRHVIIGTFDHTCVREDFYHRCIKAAHEQWG